jgi:hypothetical protein
MPKPKADVVINIMNPASYFYYGIAGYRYVNHQSFGQI